MTTQLFLKRFFLLTALVALTLPQGCDDDDPVDDPASNTNTEPQPTPEPEPEPESQDKYRYDSRWPKAFRSAERELRHGMRR